MSHKKRLSSGIPELDSHLGGGLLPGTLAVVMGGTGIGKTQIGLQFLNAGLAAEGRRGVILDMTSRGDSQGHLPYADRICDWRPESVPGDQVPDLTDFFSPDRSHGDYLHIFDYTGRRVTRHELDWDEWRHWQAELNARLRTAIAFLYGNLVRGSRRVVMDGIEPVVNPQESIQFQLFDYVYHQILRKDPEWVARDLFREQYRAQAAAAAAHVYDPGQVGCLLLATSAEVMLDDLIGRHLDEGDVLSNANTIVLMGKIREGNRLRRGLYIAKHRGSACTEEILPYEVTSAGIRLV